MVCVHQSGQVSRGISRKKICRMAGMLANLGRINQATLLPDGRRQSSDAIVRNPQFYQPLEPSQILSYRAHTHPSNITHPKRPPAPYPPHVPRQPRGAPERRNPRSYPLIDSYWVQASQLRLLAELPPPAVHCVCRLIGYEASVGETPCLEPTQLSRFHKCSDSSLER